MAKSLEQTVAAILQRSHGKTMKEIVDAVIASQPLVLREVKRPVRTFKAWTDLLDPDGKPYLVLNTNTGEAHVLYWKAWFIAGRWNGSNWYDEPNPSRGYVCSKKWNGYPKQERVFELPWVKYAPPCDYTHNSTYKPAKTAKKGKK